MEYCPHCRAIRRSRKTSRTRTEVRDGQEVTVRVDTYQCAQCSRQLYTNERVLEPTPAAAEPEGGTEESLADESETPAPEGS